MLFDCILHGSYRGSSGSGLGHKYHHASATVAGTRPARQPALPPHPYGGFVSKHPSQLACVVRYTLQHASHTLHPCSTDSHAAVPLSCPQLCGVTHLHESTHACAVCVPCAARESQDTSKAASTRLKSLR